jgi:hypothetical protein
VPVIAFLCGLFPEQALQYVKEKTKAFVYRSESRADELPLDMIEGISLFHKSRLNEVGIDNAQNLAEANLVELTVRTPFKPPVLVDWIAQARLYVLFKADIGKLRDAGVRTVLDFRELATTEGQLESLARLSGLDQERLTAVHFLLAKDKILDTLLDARARFGRP